MQPYTPAGAGRPNHLHFQRPRLGGFDPVEGDAQPTEGDVARAASGACSVVDRIMVDARQRGSGMHRCQPGHHGSALYRNQLPDSPQGLLQAPPFTVATVQ
ncbi:hypothetical protein D3C80_1987390 [compost metagenome]